MGHHNVDRLEYYNNKPLAFKEEKEDDIIETVKKPNKFAGVMKDIFEAAWYIFILFCFGWMIVEYLRIYSVQPTRCATVYYADTWFGDERLSTDIEQARILAGGNRIYPTKECYY